MFGGKPCPFLFSEVSESVTDLSNAIVRCPSWDPKLLRPTHSELLGVPRREDPDAPLAQARSMMVDTETDEFGASEVFLDDLLSAFPDLSEDHVERCSLAPLLALDTVSRPVQADEPLPRDAMLAIEKALAEGTPAEIQIVLGWLIDTHRLLISLPPKKFNRWIAELNAVLVTAQRNGRLRHRDLEPLLGRLELTANILVEGNHFLNRIRSAEMRAREHGGTRLCVETRRDLELWKAFLGRAHSGIDINLLVYRTPDHIIRTDACEFGLGGYSLTTGLAWRWEVPLKDQQQKSINFLEFLACIAGIMLSIVKGEGAPGDCYLSLGDNTSSLGWLRKSNFAADTEQASHSALARNFALTMADNSLCHFSQWFPGKENEVADLLSRDHNRSNTALTKHILHLFPKQVSPAFRISPLPREITSWLEYWVQHRPDTTESPPPLTKRQTPTSTTGSNSSATANSMMTSSSMTSATMT